MKKNKVIIIDDEPDLSSALELWLSIDYEVICFDSALSFLAHHKEFTELNEQATCLILDFQMPGMNGVELQRVLRLMNAKFPIIFISGNAQKSEVIDAWRGGAVDFILKPFTPQEITEILEKQFKLIKSLNSSNISQTHKANPIPSITKREAEVLLLLGKGKLQHEVAAELGISVRTVKMYRQFLKNKLGLNTLGQLTRFFLENESSIESTTRLK